MFPIIPLPERFPRCLPQFINPLGRHRLKCANQLPQRFPFCMGRFCSHGPRTTLFLQRPRTALQDRFQILHHLPLFIPKKEAF
jgi:hypothetical protein